MRVWSGSGVRGRRPTWSASCGAGDRSTGAPSAVRPRDGTVVLRGRLEPEVGALLLKAIAAARETLYPRTRIGGEVSADPMDQPPTAPQQRADALALLAETALHHGLDPGTPGERYQVVVHVDA